MSDAAILRIVIDVLNKSHGEFGVVHSDLEGVGQAAAEAKPHTAGLSSAFESMTGVSLTAAGALTAIGSALVYSIGQAAEAEEVMAQTRAVIESTGGAAGLSAEQVADLAGALSASTKFSDDQIQAGENLLLTFTNIGADVFPRATEAMLDMATAMGTDAKSQAIALGKALNDPVQGVTALTRVGVTFTDQQKKMIETMQEAGDVAGAQAVILDELSKEFGGSAAAAAETYTGKLARLKNNVDNLAEAIGGYLVPLLSDATETLLQFATNGEKVTAMLNEHAQSVLETSSSYTEYLGEVTRAEVAAGRMSEAEREMILADTEGRAAQEFLASSTRAVTQAFFEASHSVDNMSERALFLADRHWNETIPAQEEVAKSAAQVKVEQELLAAALKGPVQAATNTYQDALLGVADKQKALQALLSDTTPNEKQTKAIDEATAALGEAEAKADAAREKLEGLTEQFIFNKAAADLDAMAALELARGMGLVDEQSYATASAVQALREDYDSNADGAISATEAAAGYTRQVLQLSTATNALQDKHITITADTIEAEKRAQALKADLDKLHNIDIYVNLTGNYANQITTKRASGGPLDRGQMSLVGEEGPELFVPNTPGYIIPHTQTQQILAGDGGRGAQSVTNINLTAQYAHYQSELELTDTLRMLTMLYGGAR